MCSKKKNDARTYVGQFRKSFSLSAKAYDHSFDATSYEIAYI